MRPRLLNRTRAWPLSRPHGGAEDIYTHKRLLPVLMLSELERPKPAILIYAPLKPAVQLPINKLPFAARSNYGRDGCCLAFVVATAAMSAPGAEVFSSWSDVVARREWEVNFAKERLERMEPVDLPLCRMERVSA